MEELLSLDDEGWSALRAHRRHELEEEARMREVVWDPATVWDYPANELEPIA